MDQILLSFLISLYICYFFKENFRPLLAKIMADMSWNQALPKTISWLLLLKVFLTFGLFLFFILFLRNKIDTWEFKYHERTGLGLLILLFFQLHSQKRKKIYAGCLYDYLFICLLSEVKVYCSLSLLLWYTCVGVCVYMKLSTVSTFKFIIEWHELIHDILESWSWFNSNGFQCTN
jgi:hypothetical protein